MPLWERFNKRQRPNKFSLGQTPTLPPCKTEKCLLSDSHFTKGKGLQKEKCIFDKDDMPNGAKTTVKD